MDNIRISVCLATYNGEKYIKEQLDSILMQLKQCDEVIISDDGSSDNTISIINEFKDERIKVFLNEGNKGLAFNFENAISKAEGNILFLSDQDDVWLLGKVENCVEILKDYDLVVTNCILTDSRLNTIHDSYFDLNKSRKGFLKNFYRSSYLGSCLAFRRDMLEDVLPFPSKLLMYHDWWIGIIADFKYKVFFLDKPMMLYRRHEHTMSCTGNESKRKFLNKAIDRFQLLYLTIKRLVFRK